MLDILAAEGVAATFFVVGQDVDQHPDLVAAMVEGGHSVQNHSFTHADLTELDQSAIRDELERATASIVSAGAPEPVCMRPPYGAYDSRVTEESQALGMETHLWDRDTRDWTEPGVDSIVDAATRATAGDVILFHDGSGDRSQTVEALPQIIDQLRADGLDFAPSC